MPYNPYAKAPKGETAAQRKVRQRKFYTFQRQYAEDTGDKSTVNKIYGKLGRKAPKTGDPGQVDKAILGDVALGAIPFGAAFRGAKLLERGGKAVADEVGSALAKRGGSKIAAKGTAILRRRAANSGPRIVGKAAVERASLPGKKALPSGTKPLAKRASAQVSTKAKAAKSAPRAAAGAIGATRGKKARK